MKMALRAPSKSYSAASGERLCHRMTRVQSLTDIKRLLEERGLAPRHALGQNFLVDQNLVRKLVDTSGVSTGDLVLEVGPGTGVLTEELLSRGCDVVACELDRGLAALLRERLGENPRFTLVEGDCLARGGRLNEQARAVLAGRPFTLVANLPYGAASPLMLTLLIDHPECRGEFVTIQREVGDRLRASVGTKDYGELGVMAQAIAEVERIALLPPECFWPRPKVTSEMTAIRRRSIPLTDEPKRLEQCCRVLFGQRRKQIGAVLKKAFPGVSITLPEGVNATNRPEELPVERLVALSKVMPGLMPDRPDGGE